MPEGGAVTAVVVEAGALGEDFDIEVVLLSTGASDGGQSVTVTLAKVTAEDGALATQAYLISVGELGKAACSGSKRSTSCAGCDHSCCPSRRPTATTAT
jgi:hypothetical protein